MKKILSLVLLSSVALGAGAQAVEGNRFFDNWSFGLMGGAAVPTRGSYFSDARAVAGAELEKQLTPVFGVGVQSVAGINTVGNHTAIDNVNTTLLAKVNLSNWFFGYKGAPRLFETEAAVGAGFNHYFGGENTKCRPSGNDFTSKLGLNFNFNLGREKAWTVALKPAIVYGLEGTCSRTPAQFNVNKSVVELAAGVTYHFRTSNGKRYFKTVKPYDQSEVDGLNAKVNDLRKMVGERDEQIRQREADIRKLQQQLNEERNRKPIVETRVNTRQTMESVVTFRQGKSVVDASQQPNVERIATYLRNHRDATVVVKGYASPEGSAEINARLALARAEAVKSLLVNKYRIAASRIKAEGQGVGNMFSEPDWNRVSICTLEGK